MGSSGDVLGDEGAHQRYTFTKPSFARGQCQPSDGFLRRAIVDRFNGAPGRNHFPDRFDSLVGVTRGDDPNLECPPSGRGDC